MSSELTVGQQSMSIEHMIRDWAKAAHSGPVEDLLLHHAEDIVMFDVPPPHQGVRGLDAYRATWPGFIEWQDSGASFDIEELVITEGTDVAFAWALIRCGTAEGFDAEPDRRLRLTVGFRRDGQQWVVTHEHHSFADTTRTSV
jgi:ketosteroid isomerase-like protein